MVRFVSVFGIAFLTLAAVALMTPSPQKANKVQPEPQRNDDPSPVASRLSLEAIHQYPVCFSLN